MDVVELDLTLDAMHTTHAKKLEGAKFRIAMTASTLVQRASRAPVTTMPSLLAHFVRASPVSCCPFSHVDDLYRLVFTMRVAFHCCAVSKFSL